MAKEIETVPHPQFGFPCEVDMSGAWMDGFTAAVALMADHPRGREFVAEGRGKYLAVRVFKDSE